MGGPPPAEEAAAGLGAAGRQLLLGGVELCRGQLLRAGLVGDYALLDLLVVATWTTNTH